MREAAGLELDPSPEAAELYLDLLKKCLTRYAFPETYKSVNYRKGTAQGLLFGAIHPLLRLARKELVYRPVFDPEARARGRDWPAEAETMIGLRRLENLQRCIEQVMRDRIPGDLIETGVWRGGATIFMRAVLKVYGDPRRVVWVADSFQGLPDPDPQRYPVDAGDRHSTFPELAVSLEDVKENFRRYDLLDDRVRFLPGWFRDTLPSAPIDQLSVIRLDGDMYASTIEALEALYPKLSSGGYLIVDDYGNPPGCKPAVDDYRAQHGINAPIEWIDEDGVFWRKP
jgi:O-methyltransferase